MTLYSEIKENVHFLRKDKAIIKLKPKKFRISIQNYEIVELHDCSAIDKKTVVLNSSEKKSALT